jgi:hypothetical protein
VSCRVPETKRQATIMFCDGFVQGGVCAFAVFGLVCFVWIMLAGHGIVPLPEMSTSRRQPIQPLLGSTAPASNNPRPTPAAGKAKALPTYLRLSGLRIHDSDTLTANIHMPYDIVWANRSIRVRGFDGWEVTRNRRTVGEITDDELTRGRRATDDAIKLLNGADAVYVQADDSPAWTYERLLAEIWVDPPGDEAELVNYADYMRSRNHARPSDPELLKQAKEKK